MRMGVITNCLNTLENNAAPLDSECRAAIAEALADTRARLADEKDPTQVHRLYQSVKALRARLGIT